MSEREQQNSFLKGTKFEQELKECPVTGVMGYYFPWNQAANDYDTTSFTPELSEGRVTASDIQILMFELRKSEFYAPNYCCKTLWLLIPAICLGFYEGMFGIVAVLLVIFLAVKEHKEREKKRNAEMIVLIGKLQEMLFSGKGVRIRMSESGAYLAVEFAWKTNNVVGLDAEDRGSTSSQKLMRNTNRYATDNEFANFQVPKLSANNSSDYKRVTELSVLDSSGHVYYPSPPRTNNYPEPPSSKH